MPQTECSTHRAPDVFQATGRENHRAPSFLCRETSDIARNVTNLPCPEDPGKGDSRAGGAVLQGPVVGRVGFSPEGKALLS